MKVTGHCHCGRIQFRAEVDQHKVVICHCTDCQNLTGTAFRVSVAAGRDSFRVLTGSPAVYIKRGANGARRAQAFCPNCASHLFTYAADEVPPASYGLRVGSLDQRRELKPSKQKWCSSALDWVMDLSVVSATSHE